MTKEINATESEEMTQQSKEEKPEEEIWKHYLSNLDYLVSSLGRVYSLKRNIYLKQTYVSGYLAITVNISGIKKTKKIHIMVLETFVGPKLPGQVDRHFPNQIKTDNKLSNLLWGSYSENTQDALLADIHGCAKLTVPQVKKIQQRIKDGIDIKDIVLEFDIDRKTILNIKNNKSWSNVGEDLSEFESFRHKRLGSKLTVNDVRLILLMLRDTNLTQKEIGKQFNGSSSAISLINLRKKYSDIEMPTMTLEGALIAHKNDEEII